jgi:hypothetical protein
MIEITNKSKSPVQLMVKSRTAPKAFTTLIIPGIGAKKNVRIIKDEMIIADITERVEKTGMISTRYIPNRLGKGE